MELQNYEKLNAGIRERFLKLKAEEPGRVEGRLRLSWSNWGFGAEPLEASLQRLARFGVDFVELHGNHYGDDLGYRPAEVRAALAATGVGVSGVCGMFSAENDLSSVSGRTRQAALDYIKRELDFASEVGASYLLVVPAAVGRTAPYDDNEARRSAETLRLVGDLFVQRGIRCAVEPIRSAETTIVHSVAQAKDYIRSVGHPGVGHINGDVFHMQAEEAHIATAILDASTMLANLHMADSQRGALGTGSMDLDSIIMALYLIAYTDNGGFVTPEPLGPGGDPYPAMHGVPDSGKLDALVGQTISYFRGREDALRA